MKQLPLKNTSYQYLQRSFLEWLDILGYSESARKNYPVHLREFFHYLETQGVSHIRKIDQKAVNEFFKYLLVRPSKTGGALSSCSINQAVTALNLFSKYVYLTGKYELEIYLKHIEEDIEQRTILSVQEIKALYDATYVNRRSSGRQFGQRDRAMLTVFYGCGLRKNEATHLNVADLKREKNLLHVRKGKGRKQRLVPVTAVGMDYLTRWLDEGRHWFLENHAMGNYHYQNGKQYPKKDLAESSAFFIGNRGNRFCSGFYARLKLLKERSEIEKSFSLHSLRHSIATHLMGAGMELEDISQFLGHSSLESTQIYTHLTDKDITEN